MIDSYEAEKFRKVLEYKKKRLAQLESNPKAYQAQQREILYLEKEIFPFVLEGSNLLHYEFGKFFLRALDASLKVQCNGVLIYLPLSDEYEEKPRIGVANFQQWDYGTSGAIELKNIEIENCDGSGIDPDVVFLNPLLT